MSIFKDFDVEFTSVSTLRREMHLPITAEKAKQIASTALPEIKSDIIDYVNDIINKAAGRGWTRISIFMDNGKITSFMTEGFGTAQIAQFIKDTYTGAGYNVNIEYQKPGKFTKENTIPHKVDLDWK